MADRIEFPVIEGLSNETSQRIPIFERFSAAPEKEKENITSVGIPTMNALSDGHGPRFRRRSDVINHQLKWARRFDKIGEYITYGTVVVGTGLSLFALVISALPLGTISIGFALAICAEIYIVSRLKKRVKSLEEE